MKKPKFYVPVIVLGLVATVAFAYAMLGWRAERPVLGSEPKPVVAYAQADKIVHEQFIKSATSIARPDLLACSNLDATFSQPVDGKPEELASMLNGVWLGRRTMHGVTVEMDTAFFVKMEGDKGTAILIDRNNLGRNSFERPLLSARNSQVAKPLMMSFVNCKYQFLDQYIKVADNVDGPQMAILAKATKTSFSAQTGLRQAWSEIISAGYFHRLGDPGHVKSVDQNGTRLAILPNGASATEKAIEEGTLPGSESYLPTVVGAFFEIELTTTVVGSRRGVSMKWIGEYHGAGVNLAPGESLTGIESGDFFREGGAFVSTVASAVSPRSAQNATGGANLTNVEAQQWTTSECGDKNQLAAAVTVQNAKGSAGAPGQAENTVIMTFDRVVIGAP